MYCDILIIDDDEHILATTKAMVNSRLPKCNCVTFSVPDEKLFQYIKDSGDNINLIICDVKIPGFDIATLAKDLYNHTKAVFLFMSGNYYEFEYFEEILGDSCVFDFIAKPFSMEPFISRLKTLLNVSRSSQNVNKKLDQTIDKLSKAKNKLYAITQHSADIIIVLDGEGKVKYATSSIIKFTGKDAEDSYGIQFTKYCANDNCRNIFHKTFNECLGKPGQSFLITGIEVENDIGVKTTFDYRLTNMIDTPGIEGIVVNSRETTIESKLRNSIWNIFNYLNFIVVLLDQDMKIVVGNFYLAQFLGYDSEVDIIGIDWLQFLPDDEKAIVSHVHEENMKEPSNDEYTEFINNLLNKDGMPVEVRWFNCPIVNGVTGTFSIGIVGNQIESIDSMRAYWKDIIQKDKTAIKAMKNMFKQKDSKERTNEC